MMSSLANLNPARIAIVKPSALGDILHGLPVLTALRRRFPRAYIAWIVNQTYDVLLNGHPDLDATLPFERHPYRSGFRAGLGKQRAFLGRLRRERFDLAIDLQGLFRAGLLTWLTGATTRIGPSSAREGARIFYTHVFQDGGFSVHAVDRYWKVIEALGDPPARKSFALPVQADATRWAFERLRALPRPWLAVGAGARWLTKRWPPAHFAELVRRAQARFGGSALFIGSPDERPLAEEAARLIKGPHLIFAGDTNLAQLTAILAAADVVLANDTGPLHIAVALGRPVVAPYTCTSVAKTGPYGQFHRAVETNVWCQGHEVRTCARLECMAELTPDRLWPALESILLEWRPSALVGRVS
jgi:heptosyltransferase-1